MQTRQRRVVLIAQNTRMPDIFDYISSGTCVWLHCIELLDGSILSFTALPGELCADAATFSGLFVRLQNIILVSEAIVKNLCMDLWLSQVLKQPLSYLTNIAVHSHNICFHETPSLFHLKTILIIESFSSTIDLKKVRRFYFCIYFSPGGAQFHQLAFNRYKQVNPAQVYLRKGC